MSTIEEELRAAFERLEPSTPAAERVRAKIEISYAQARRRRGRRRAAGAALAVLAAGVGVPLSLGHHQAPVTPVPLAGTSVTATTSPVARPESVDVLILGIRGEDFVETRPDVTLLAHVPAGGTTAYLIPLPTAPVAEAWVRGGRPQMHATISKLYGIDLAGTVTTDFRSLAAVTGSLGGVTACLPGCRRLDADGVAEAMAQPGDRVGRVEALMRAISEQARAQKALTDHDRLRQLVISAGSGTYLSGAGTKGLQTLLTTLGTMGDTEVVALSAGDPALYRAVGDDKVGDWVAAHPASVMK